MSGETEDQVSGWTTDTLHAHLNGRIADQRAYFEARLAALTGLLDERHHAQSQAVAAALLSAEKAVGKAETAAEKRFDAVNEFRAQLADQASTFMPRSESEARASALAEKVDALDKRLDKAEGRTSGSTATWGYLVAGVGLLLAVIGVVLTVIR